MIKLVVLKFIQGNFEQGFSVILEIGNNNSCPTTVIQGCLPPMPEMIQYYKNWQLAYRQLALPFRGLERKKAQVTNISTTQDCRKLALILGNSLNIWLDSETFRPVKEGFLKYINPDEEIRLIIQTENIQLRQLPWHLWKIIEDYRQAEISFSPLEYQQLIIAPPQNHQQRVKILVILGESPDIQVGKDLEFLQQKLPDAEILPLINPQVEQLSSELWQQTWDILFFAGHSSSDFIDGQGRFYLNQSQSLTINELKFALKNAIANGLRLAIFNSCDGLHLAKQLEDVRLPASIVMQERIADEAAQKFLEYFLTPFREGKSLHLCVREARKRLHSLDKYPCASWLPVICSYPAADNISWQKLGGIPPCPYKGLSAFQAEDASVFYGREALINKLIEAVKYKKLVAVVGASGSGKSSAVFAGLIPRLREQITLEFPLKIACFRPGNSPFDALATALLSVNLTALSAQQLQQYPDVLSQAIDGHRLLLVADQFEELYTLVSEAERLLFLDTLLTAVNSVPGLTLVLTLRADFCGRVLEYEPLAKALQQYPPELIIPMNRQELQAAIALPAQKRGVSLQSGLVECIINDIHQQPGKLPLLEFALTQLWSKQQHGILSLEAYQEIGGVEKALTNHAQKIYTQLDRVERKRAEQIFIQLVQPGEGTEDTRRIATKADVGDNWDLVAQLASARLVVTGERKGGETVEIAHETLINNWGELQRWMQQNRDFRSWQERLRMAMVQWDKSNQDQEALLRGFLLVEAEDWLQRRQAELSYDEQNFIQTSINQRNTEQQEKEQQRQARIAALTSGLILAIGLAGIACWQWQRAELQKQLIEITAINTFSENLLLAGKEFDSLLESLKAAKLIQKFNANPDTSIQVATVLQQALYKVRESNRLEAHSDRVMSVSWSADGEHLVSAGFDRVAKIWRKDGTLVNTLLGHTDTVFDVAFSPDGQLIATASFDRTVKIWSLNGTLIRTITGHNHSVLGVAWAPDGKKIATASEDKTVKLWNLDGALIHTFVGHTDTVFNVTFSPDGNIIASAGWDNTAKLWKLDGTLLQTLTGHTDQVDSVAFSPDGNLIATASADEDKTIKLWQRNTSLNNPQYQQIKTFIAHNDTIYHLKFSPNGNILASGSKDGTVKLWDTKGKLQQTFTGHTNSVNSISFSPDGQSIASASTDGTVRTWSITGAVPVILQAVGKPLLDINFSPSGQQIITTEQQGKIRLWQPDGQQQLEFGEEQTYISAAFSPDNVTIATAAKDNTVKIWSRDGSLIQSLHGHTARVFDIFFSPDNDLIATASADSTVKIWRRNGVLVTTIPAHDREVLAVAWSPDGKILASGGSDRTVKLWNLQGELLQTITGHSDRVMNIAWSLDGQIIASASQDQTIKLWSLDGSLLHTLTGHTDIVNSVAFSPDNQFIVSASEDSAVKLWSLNGSLLATLRGHKGGINSVDFSPDGKTIASAGNDGIAILWSLDLKNLTARGCDWVRNYLQNNPQGKAKQHLCDI
ncbi:CHAT domain-containing protein [Calothrix sp. FACHB-1219]|uniref:nSTAND1 domain-containing NTPase n=1 Tax=unclassified Calothrix TaxID=2619626 RepID=UPI001685AD0D|nr:MULTISPECIES: CHAT domain-containing protein [unclassified Calothrix]MBD2207429.1 CHAT domain-containing protein [Calothrix sp. FACHB-168]MBD2222005.1 CHAT domain-containing protein [Calothrix sp. FACHB-1219]